MKIDLSTLNPNKWNLKVFFASGRNWVSYAAGGVTMLAVWGLFGLTSHDATGIIDNINTIWDGVMKIATGIAGLAAILTPVYTSIRAGQSATPKAQVESATEAAKTDPEVKKQMVDSVANMPQVTAVVAPALADMPNPKVVASPAEVSK